MKCFRVAPNVGLSSKLTLVRICGSLSLQIYAHLRVRSNTSPNAGRKLSDILDIQLSPRCFGLTKQHYCDRTSERANTCQSVRLDSGRRVIALLMEVILHREGVLINNRIQMLCD